LAVLENFGDFTLDSESRTLSRGARAIRLRAKAFDLLCLLVAERPRVVSRDALKRSIWPATHVTDGSLDELVKVLRRALEDDARNPQFIKTHPGGRGFSFCGTTAGRGQALAAGFRLVWEGRVFPLPDGDNLIGRAPHCQVVIADTTVSREHARIRCDSAAGEATIEHLSRVNRTLVGGEEVMAPRRLRSGDTLELGLAHLEFQHAGDATQSISRRGGP
jgi:hypothetical protein